MAKKTSTTPVVFSKGADSRGRDLFMLLNHFIKGTVRLEKTLTDDKIGYPLKGQNFENPAPKE
ncbi:MAG: hypothetical protein KBD90_05260 [Alphaproteobacteria bacterium]|nr:hypothetical protein [Alphaproteobacteria bacterium]